MTGDLLQPNQIPPWREKEVPLEKRGIRLDWLAHFVSRAMGGVNAEVFKHRETVDEMLRLIEQRPQLAGDAGAPSLSETERKLRSNEPPVQYLNTHILVSEVVKPITQAIHAPLYALVPKQFRGKPTTFVSHGWNALLMGPQRQRVGTFDALGSNEREYVWIDFACYNQHAHDSISQDMEKLIKSIGNVTVAVTPIPLYSRSWCLWELYCAERSRARFELRVCPGYRNDKILAVNTLYRSFQGVDLAQSTSPVDQSAILKAFEKRFGGVAKANAKVQDLLKKRLSSDWHELQDSSKPLQFSPDPWTQDKTGQTLKEYDPYWEPGFLDGKFYATGQTIRDLFARSGTPMPPTEDIRLDLERDNPNYAVLEQAVLQGDNRRVFDLIGDFDLDFNRPLAFRSTLAEVVCPPIFYAILSRHVPTLDVLCLSSADKNLEWTFETGSSPALMFDSPMDEIFARTFVWTPLMLAAAIGSPEVCDRLLASEAVAPDYAPDPSRLTALHLAAAGGHRDIVGALVAAGTPLGARDQKGRTPEELAVQFGHGDCVALLR